MSQKSFLRSFAGGEIATELFGRLDLTKNQTGLARCRNFIVLPHGPLANRPGWEFVNETKDSSKKSVLIPFIYSTEQSYVLEVGDQYFRIHANGATVLATAQNITGISKANPGVLTYAGADTYANGDVVFLTGIVGMTQLNGRFVKVAGVNTGANTFQLTDLAGANIDTTGYTTYVSGGTVGEILQTATPYLEADLFDLHYTQSADVMTVVHPTYQQRQISRASAVSWPINTFTLVPTIGTPAAPTVGTGGPGGGTPSTHTYVITAVAADTLEESLASASSNASIDLTVAGNQVGIAPSALVTGAIRYNIYKQIAGLYGYIGQTDSAGVTFLDTNITPDLTQTAPEGTDPFGSAGNYPGAVGYFKGRRWFAGTTNSSQNLWATRAGTESNLTYSIPTRDDDRIAVRLTARQANRIRHIVPLDSLLLLTQGAEWQVGTVNSDVLAPASIDYKARGYIGANNVQPVVAGEAVMYAQAKGGRVREMKQSETSVNGSFVTTDISIMAPHLFDRFTIVSMAYTHAPYKTAWFVRSDGKLLGLTYVPEHQVAAWHQHDTDGFYESVAAIPEGNEDVLYAVIKRTINGRTVRNVERLHSRQFSRLQDAFFVDSGASFNNTVAATLTPGAGATVAGTEDVIFTAGSAVFASTDVDRYIHYDYETTDDDGQPVYLRAQALITEYTDTTHVKATIEAAWPALTAIASAGWRMTITEISGLWHLIGETVAVLADGAVYPQSVVTAAGKITLEQPASKGCIGLPYNSDAMTVPLALEAQAFGQGMKSNVNRVTVRVDMTSGLFVGPSFDKLREAKQRTDEPYGTPPDLVTGTMRVMLTPTWKDDAQICIRQANPLPCTVVALVPDTAYGG